MWHHPKKWQINLFSIFVLILLILLCAEYLLRRYSDPLFNRFQAQHYRNEDPVFHHGFIPNGNGILKSSEYHVKYSINSFGIRDREYSNPKPHNYFRILMLGDSFTEGYGVESENTFAKQLERLCNPTKKNKYNIEVINLGCASYSPILEYLLLKQKGLKLNPDLVILNYDMSDIKDDYYYSRIAKFTKGGIPKRVSPDVYISDKINIFEDFLEKNFLIYYLFRKRLFKRNDEKYKTQIGFVGDYADRYVFSREKTGEWQRLWSLSKKYIELIDDLLKKNNIPFIICSYPYGHQVNGNEWKEGRKLYGFKEGHVYSTRAFRLMTEYCRKRQINFINTLPYFVNFKGGLLFYPYDGHFTRTGHKLMAEIILKYLLRNMSDVLF